MTVDFDVCYRALQARDARFDGLFFTGVSTTRIYCRPICAARTPKLTSCQFFSRAAAAEQAGFRPCLRCRPELAPLECNSRFCLEQMLYREIQDHALEGRTLENLTPRTGYSTRQMRRLMADAFGLTPVAIAQTERLLFAKKLLHETSLPITRIALDAGFRSLRRFNTLFLARYGMAPQTLRRQAHLPSTDEPMHLRLAYRPPFAWEKILAYLRARAIPQVEWVTPQSYARTMEIRGRKGWFSVRNLPEQNVLEVNVAPEFSGDLAIILRKIRGLFDLDANPVAIELHLQNDPALAPLIQKNPGLRVPGAWDIFELSVRAILGQQISVAGATTLAGRFAKRFGTTLETPIPELSQLGFSAEILAATTPEEIASIGLPKARARTLHELALATVAGRLDFPPAASQEVVLRTLQSIPGIGPWTSNYIAMRALRWPDAFPTGDLGLLKATGISSIKELEKLSAAWRPWRAYATLHLWHSLS